MHRWTICNSETLKVSISRQSSCSGTYELLWRCKLRNGFVLFFWSLEVMAEDHLPDCPQCDSPMPQGPKPFMRIFGDIRAFECPACDYILILKYPFNSMVPDQAVGLKDEAAE